MRFKASCRIKLKELATMVVIGIYGRFAKVFILVVADGLETVDT
jgi:hypothetical protein